MNFRVVCVCVVCVRVHVCLCLCGVCGWMGACVGLYTSSHTNEFKFCLHTRLMAPT